MEIVTKKKLMLYSGTTHPALAEEIAEHLGIPISPCVIRRFGSGEIYVRPEDSVRGADVFVIQTHAEPINESIMEQLVLLDAMKRARYDLVFMDMRMPGMDGPTAARRLRERGDATPIVALTANAFAEDRKACLEAGMDDHLVKPLELEALRSALARWTNRADRAKVAVA